MRPGRSTPTEEPIGVASGRLRWTPDGDDLVTRRYRIRPQAAHEWELVYRDQLVRLYERRSMALAWAEHHHREKERTRRITQWTTLAGAALCAATVALNHITELWGYPVFSVSVGVFLGSFARAQAAATRNLLDPYRPLEKGEPPDWWNRNL